MMLIGDGPPFAQPVECLFKRRNVLCIATRRYDECHGETPVDVYQVLTIQNMWLVLAECQGAKSKKAGANRGESPSHTG